MDTRASVSLPLALGTTVVLAALVGLVALLTPAWFSHQTQELRAQRGWTSTPAETQQVQTAQRAQLEGYRWLDRKAGVVALPIERAMELTQVRLLQAQEAAR